MAVVVITWRRRQDAFTYFWDRFSICCRTWVSNTGEVPGKTELILAVALQRVLEKSCKYESASSWTSLSAQRRGRPPFSWEALLRLLPGVECHGLAVPQSSMLKQDSGARGIVSALSHLMSSACEIFATEAHINSHTI